MHLSLLSTLLLLPVLLAPTQPHHSPTHRAVLADADNSIRLLSLNQPPCSVPDQQAVFRAKIASHLTAAEQSEYGYSVSIKFQSTNPDMTFSSGTQGDITITQKTDTLTLTYPLAAVWRNPRLLRPVTCYFYLHRNIGPGRSTVVAKTPPVVFRECQ